MPIKPIHPFPARMAPEIALRAVAELPERALVLDPMSGSGTVLRAAAERGHRAIGYDLDPLAVLMASVWNSKIDPTRLVAAGYKVLDQLSQFDNRRKVELPWIDRDNETKAFTEFWFARKQRMELRRISFLLHRKRGPIANALRIALSRTIIRKEGGASLANDVSHSRPHIVRTQSNYSVADGFETAFLRLATLFTNEPPPGRASAHLGDGRSLNELRAHSVDAIVTSPPYLNAIDYLRGHKMTLVWLGFKIPDLREIRADSIGAERAFDKAEPWTRAISAKLGDIDSLPQKQQRMVDRYIVDLHRMLSEARRVLRPNGTAIFVVGNSCLKGVFIRNSDALALAATRVGLTLTAEDERALPATKRYLPPPTTEPSKGISNRMRTEVVLRFKAG